MPADPAALAAFTPPTLAAVAAVFVLAGGVKGVVGLGLPTLSMALLALFMPPTEAATLLIVPSLATNVWQMRPFGTLRPLLRRLWPLQLAACAGTWVAAACFGTTSAPWAAQALGVALVAYGAWALVGAQGRVPARVERWGAPIAGVLTGAVTASTGVFVVPAVPWLQALGLARDELIQAMGLSFTVSTIALALALAAGGHWSGATAGASVAMLAPAIAGMAAGQWLRRRLSPPVFRTCFLASLVVLGLYMAARPFLAP